MRVREPRDTIAMMVTTNQTTHTEIHDDICHADGCQLESPLVNSVASIGIGLSSQHLPLLIKAVRFIPHRQPSNP